MLWAEQFSYYKQLHVWTRHYIVHSLRHSPARWKGKNDSFPSTRNRKNANKIIKTTSSRGQGNKHHTVIGINVNRLIRCTKHRTIRLFKILAEIIQLSKGIGLEELLSRTLYLKYQTSLHTNVFLVFKLAKKSNCMNDLPLNRLFWQAANWKSLRNIASYLFFYIQKV